MLSPLMIIQRTASLVKPRSGLFGTTVSELFPNAFNNLSSSAKLESSAVTPSDSEMRLDSLIPDSLMLGSSAIATRQLDFPSEATLALYHGRGKKLGASSASRRVSCSWDRVTRDRSTERPVAQASEPAKLAR